MEYPGSHFSRRWRLLMLGFFITSFLIISPLVILATEGYRYDWHNWRNGFLKETGSISIDIEPPNALLYLDGIKISGHIPYRLNNLTARKYVVRMTAPGFYDWQKEIEVQNKQAVYIKEIAMLKKFEPQLLKAGSAGELWLSDDGIWLVYAVTAKNAQKEVWLYNTQTNKTALIMRTPNDSTLFFSCAKKNTFCALAKGAYPFNQIQILDITHPEQLALLPLPPKKNITKLMWKDASDPLLFYSTTSTIFSWSPQDATFTVVNKFPARDWFLDKDRLWLLTLSTTTRRWEITSAGLGLRSLFATVSAEPSDLTDTSSTWNLAYVDQTNVLLKRPNRPEAKLLTPGSQFSVASDHWLVSRYNHWWLLWTPWELWTYTTGEDPHLLNRSGEQLQTVVPLDEHNTLALVWKNKTTVLFPYYYIYHDMPLGSVTALVADPVAHTMYFSSNLKGTKGLWKLSY